MKNKYKNTKEFIEEFKKSSSFTLSMSSLIKSGKMSDITEGTLKECGINPDPNGYYRNSQFLELHQKINKDIEKRFGSLYSLALPIRSREFNFISNTRPYEIKRLLLLTLSDKFQKKIKGLREKYGIPENGFKNDKKLDKWEKSISAASFDQLTENSQGLFHKYRLRLSAGVGLTYVISELDFQWLFKQIEVEPILTSVSFERFQRKLKNPYPPLSDYSYIIAITQPVTKKKIKSYIDKHWQMIKKEMEDFFKPVTLNKEFRRDFLIYSSHKAGKDTKEVRGLLTQYGFEGVSEYQIRQTIVRLRKRIAELEVVTQK